MLYKEYDIPYINKGYSYKNDKSYNRVICSVSNDVKILSCDADILEEVLSYVDGKNTLEFIENKFIDRYEKEEVQEFLRIILQEEIIKIKYNENKSPLLLAIGDKYVMELLSLSNIVDVDNFLQESFDNLYDIAIILPGNITNEKMLRINEKLYELNKPFIQMSYNGTNISIGPLVVPGKSACLQCDIEYSLKKLNSKIKYAEVLKLEDIKDFYYAVDMKDNIEFSKIKYLIDILKQDIENFYNGNESKFLDYKYVFNLEFLEYVRKEQYPTTYCKHCKAFNENYTISKSISESIEFIEKKEISILCENDIKYRVGGVRSKTEEETKKSLEEDLYKLGAKIKIEPALGNPFNDKNIINCYNSFIEQYNLPNIPYLFRKNEGAGKGITKTQSFFSAAFELLEHIALQYTGDIPIMSAKYKEVKDLSIDMKVIENSIKNNNTIFDKFNEDEEIDWVVAISLTGEKKLIPASLVFMYDVELKGSFFASSSNGAGAGLTLEDAILHGLFEIIERDAWLIGQSNPYVLPIINYDSITNQNIKNIIHKIKNMGYDIVTRDYTNDIGIPVYRTWIVNPNDYSRYAYMGLGCHISPELALERSITEAVQIEDWSDTGGEIDSDMMTLEVLDKSLVNVYNQHHLVNKDVLGKTSEIIDLPKLNCDIKNSYDILLKVAERIKEVVGGDIYYVELTKPEFNVKVVRVIVSGDIQRMNIPLISVSDRMFKFGINCGYSDKETKYEELFMGRYQH